MQPVNLLSDVKAHWGSWGYSALVTPWGGGQPMRQTMVFIHDANGRFQFCMVMDAATVLGKVW